MTVTGVVFFRLMDWRRSWHVADRAWRRWILNCAGRSSALKEGIDDHLLSQLWLCSSASCRPAVVLSKGSGMDRNVWFPMTRLSAPSLELTWGTCQGEKFSDIWKELYLTNSLSLQPVPQPAKQCPKLAGSFAELAPGLLGNSSVSLTEVHCTLLLKPCQSCLSSVRGDVQPLLLRAKPGWDATAKGAEGNYSICACVANVSGCRDAVTRWLSLGKGRGTIPLKSLTGVTAGF